MLPKPSFCSSTVYVRLARMSDNIVYIDYIGVLLLDLRMQKKVYVKTATVSLESTRMLCYVGPIITRLSEHVKRI